MFGYAPEVYARSLAMGFIYALIGVGLAKARSVLVGKALIKKLVWLVYGGGNLVVGAVQFNIFMSLTRVHPFTDIPMAILNCGELLAGFIALGVFMFARSPGELPEWDGRSPLR